MSDAIKPSPSLKKIWFFAYGSRGDIQPYVAVGAALVKRGYQVTFFTSEKYADFASDYGLKGVATEPCFDDVIRSSSELLACMAGGDAKKVFESVGKVNDQHAAAKCERIMAELKLHGLPDLCLTMSLSGYFGWYFSIRHHVPHLSVMTFAFSYNKEHMHMGLPTLPFGLHYPFFYKLILNAAADGFKSFEDYFGTNFANEFGKRYILQQMKNPTVPMVVLMSPEIASVLFPPEHASPFLRFVGTTVLEQHQQLLDKPSMFGGPKALEDMQAFITASDKKPVYLGWGSMILKSPEYMVEFCARAVYQAQQRAIVLGGVAQISLELLLENKTNVEAHIIDYAKKNILFVTHAPHEWLFPQMAAVVHHGGAGTTTASLRGGTPTIITPVLIDQYDFSYAVRKLGVGIGFEKQLQYISSKELGDAVKLAVSDAGIILRAAELGKKLNRENGADKAAEEVEDFWKQYCVTGQFQQIFPGDSAQKFNTSSMRRNLFLSVIVIAPVAAAIKYLLGPSSK